MIEEPEIDLTQPYRPTALYYEEADSVEYVRCDVASVCERVDERLTLVLAMMGREPIGFRLKGFKNFYMQDLARTALGGEFYSLVGALERAVSDIGDEVFAPERKAAYGTAWKIALDDRVALSDLPKVA